MGNQNTDQTTSTTGTSTAAGNGAGNGAGDEAGWDPQSFDHLPARYDRYGELVGAELRAWLAFHVWNSGCGTVRALDAGCGTGLHAQVLADRFTEVLAVDLSAPMLDHARRHRARGNVRYERRDLMSVTVATDGPFDAVVCAYTLHHLPDLTAALWHLRSLVRPGGVALVVDVVDDRGSPPRAWLRRQAWTGFVAELRHRPAREAVELLRLALDREWLDHQSTDRLTGPAEWDALARAVFPGATIATLGRAHALAWTAPHADHHTPDHHIPDRAIPDRAALPAESAARRGGHPARGGRR